MEYVGEAMETGILPGHGNVTEKYGAAIMMEGHHRYLASLITDKPFLIMRSTDPWGAPLHWTRLHWWEKVCFWWEVVVVK
jgi:hypothetical protein